MSIVNRNCNLRDKRTFCHVIAKAVKAICKRFITKKAQKQRPLGLVVFEKAVETLHKRFSKKQLKGKKGVLGGQGHGHGNERMNLTGEGGKILVDESFGRVKVCV